jgi:hypothetical protein
MQRLGASLTAILSLLSAAADTPALAEDAILRMTQGDCKRLVDHQPAPNVAHQPGVDVRGNVLAPAETGGDVGLELSDDLVISIEFDLFERLGSAPGRIPLEAKVLIGTIELHGGRAYFNGRPLETAIEADLVEKCRQGLKQDG